MLKTMLLSVTMLQDTPKPKNQQEFVDLRDRRTFLSILMTWTLSDADIKDMLCIASMKSHQLGRINNLQTLLGALRVLKTLPDSRTVIHRISTHMISL